MTSHPACSGWRGAPSGFALRSLLAAAALACAPMAYARQPQFTCMGIGGGGQMYGVGISPHDGKLLHVSSDMGTFYVTEDGGANWTMVDQLDMVGTTATRPAYHPTDPDVLYMPYVRGNRNQLRISRDRGYRWEVLCDDAPWGNANGRDKYERGVASIDLDPADAKCIFVSAPTGLFRSLDGGRRFDKCEDVTGNVIGAFAVPFGPAGSRVVMAASSEGFFLSEDGGSSWRRKGPQPLSENLLSFSAAADAQTRRLNLYAATPGTVLVSTDGGDTFTATKPSSEPEVGAYRFVAASASDPRTAYVSSMGPRFGVWKTTDGGVSWNQVFHRGHKGIRWGWIGLELGTSFGGRANRITVDPRDADRLAYVNTTEFFLTENGGATWRELCSRYVGPVEGVQQKNQPWAGVGLEVALPTDMVWDPFVKNRVYLIYGDIGLIVSEDRGASWRPRRSGIPRSWSNRMWELVADPVRKGVLYAACSGQHGTVHDVETLRHDGGVVLSRDHGETWSPAGVGLPAKGVPCTGLALDPRSPPEARTLYCVMQNDGVYKSDDGGLRWRKLPVRLGRDGNHNVEQVRVAADGSVYALVIGRSRNWKFTYAPGGLWRSVDGGETWTEVTAALSLMYPKEFAVHPQDPDRIYLATTQAPGGEAAGLWETRNAGADWRQVVSTRETGKELFGYIHSGPVSFHPARPGWIYYATKTHGLWFTQDDGATWRRLLGIPRLAVHRVIADPDDSDTIYVTSVGLWKGPAQGL